MQSWENDEITSLVLLHQNICDCTFYICNLKLRHMYGVATPTFKVVEAAFQNSLYRVTENKQMFILQSFAGLCFLVNTAGSIAVVYTVNGTTNLFNVSHAQPSHTVQCLNVFSS